MLRAKFGRNLDREKDCKGKKHSNLRFEYPKKTYTCTCTCRSRGRYADHDKHTVSSSRSSSNPRRLPRSHDSIMTKTSHVSSNNTGNSRGGLPRYDVYDNRAFAVSEAGPRSAEHPSGRHQPYGVLY